MAEVIYHDSAERELLSTGQAREAFQRVGDRVADVARHNAPRGHPSHGGAESIHAVAVLGPNGWTVQISWDLRHYYMTFSEVGTVHMHARPFLRPALTGTRI